MRKLLYAVTALLLVACGSSDNAKSAAPAKVRMHTTAGVIELCLYDETPKHRDNFLKLVEEQQFDSLLFHRVIKDFMIQGGDPTSKHAPAGTLLGEGDLGYTIEAEFMPERYFHRRGEIGRAHV